MGLSDWELAAARAAIARGLDEDLRYGPDVTTLATVPASATTTASLVTREAGVVAGLDVALLTLNEVLGTNGYRVLDRVEDGARVPPGEALMTLEAQTRGLLTAERTMLNLVGHLSGIATATAAWVDAVRGTKAKIRDTRKTLPGLRALQKYAVRTGGGVNHRLGLGDAALIKDNHVAAAGSVVDALRAVRNAAPDLPCEVEVDSLEQLDAVLPEKPELILLDNFRCGRRRPRCSVGTRARPPSCWSHPVGSACRRRRPTPKPGWTTWRSGRSHTQCACSTSAWICSRAAPAPIRRRRIG